MSIMSGLSVPPFILPVVFIQAGYGQYETLYFTPERLDNARETMGQREF